MQYLIGTGGWAYFNVPRLNPLVAYSRAFNFVEINSTFYHIPRIKEVERWRTLVPRDFQFSVRANRIITHTERLQPTSTATDALAKMAEICETLKTDMLHLQTPAYFKLNHSSITGLKNLISTLKLNRIRLILELREKSTDQIPKELITTMRELNMIHCTDLSKGDMPAYESDTVYTRLFGRGKHNRYEPTDEELEEIDRKVSNTNSQRITMSFHFVRMYKDAARMKTYKQTGRFPKITRSTGVSSLEEVLSEDASFPATRLDLLENEGWKLFDMTENIRLRASDILLKLPQKKYKNIEEVAAELNSIVR